MTAFKREGFRKGPAPPEYGVGDQTLGSEFSHDRLFNVDFERQTREELIDLNVV